MSEFAGATRRLSRVERWYRPEREELAVVNLLSTAALSVAAFWTVRPFGLSGTPLAVLLLVVVNVVLLATRHVPETRLHGRGRVLVLYAGVLASAALTALGRSGVSQTFGFFVSGHAGYRLASGPAVRIAVACSVANGGVLLLGWGGGHWSTPWWVGAMTGLPVVFGMLNRSRQELYRSALAAAESADRAAQAEAREQILNERGRIARDVHDVLAHSLAGISMQLNLANALLDQGEVTRAREVTGSAQALVRESLLEAQRTVQSLRADALPVVDTIRAMVRPHEHAELTVAGEVRELTGPAAYALVRAAQESLTNAHKYAPNAPVTVGLDYAAAAVTLTVTNGPRPAEAPLAVAGGGLGLVGMRERVDAVGGTVVAGPTAAGGWQVRVTIPA